MTEEHRNFWDRFKTSENTERECSPCCLCIQTGQTYPLDTLGSHQLALGMETLATCSSEASSLPASPSPSPLLSDSVSEHV